ncbi:MAG TPA: alpha-amylase family glycosyl hydrolase [Humisphaera sp.]
MPLLTSVLDAEVNNVLRQAQLDAASHPPNTKTVTVDGKPVPIPSPFPSPGDWRDQWIYFLLLDRFNNPKKAPTARWDQRFDFHQGGTFKGVQAQLKYLSELGVGAIWLSPVLKNSRPDGFAYTYPGYNTQDFLNLDPRLASDGTLATAEKEFAELVDEAHARGMYVVLDIVLNHAGRVFDYVIGGQPQADVKGDWLMNAPLGGEPPIQWLNGLGFPRSDWENAQPPAPLGPDDAVFPVELQRPDFFRRRGTKLTDAPGDSFVRGDFGTMRQLVVEYAATAPGQRTLRDVLGSNPVLSVLVRAYQYLIAKYDVDGFRIDTVKYVDPEMVETFGNAVREYALSVGKRNFFTFGEVYDDNRTIAKFVGRNGGGGDDAGDSYGIDAALDFPLFFTLPKAATGLGGVGVESVRQVFRERKALEAGLLSSHGEASRFFVTFLDNHDQNERFNTPGRPAEQVTLGIALLFALQGIPCLYYGTEQGLRGTTDGNGNPTTGAMESVREALWGKPNPFDQADPFYKQIQAIAGVRSAEAALRYGRLYFRPVSGNGQDFGHPSGTGGVIAFSRILTNREVLVVANTSFGHTFDGRVMVDADLNPVGSTFKIAYSNVGTSGQGPVDRRTVTLHGDAGSGPADVASFFVALKPMEVQILVPA